MKFPAFIAVSLFAAQLCAQVLQPRQYSRQDGLAHSTVYRVCQDRQGFLWFSTDYGISRFDGSAFVNYGPEQTGGSTTILSVAEYGDEKWLCTYGSGVRILANDVSRKPEVDGDSMPHRVTYTLRDRPDRTWIIEVHGALYTLSGKQIRRVSTHLRFRKMIAAADGSVIFTSWNGLFRYTDAQGMQPFLSDIISGETNDVCEAAPGEYWISGRGKIFHVANGKLLAQFDTGVEEGSGALIVAADKSAWYCAPAAGVLRISNGQLLDYTEKLGLEGKLVNDIFSDREGNLWFATHGDGVFCLYEADVFYYPVAKQQISLYAASVTPRNNGLLVGSFGTVSTFDSVLCPLKLRGLHVDEYVYSVVSDGPLIYTGTSKKIIVCNTLSGEEEYIPYAMLSCYKDAHGQLWMGSYRTAGRLLNDGHGWRLDTLDFPRRVGAIGADEQQRILFGTDSGLYVFDGVQPQREPGFPDSLRVQSILLDSQQRLWVATMHGLGLREKGKWTFFSMKDGLNHWKCNALAEDATQRIWVGTMNGLNCVDRRDGKTIITAPDFSPNEILSLAVTPDQTLWAGMVNGVMSMMLQQKNALPAFVPDVYILHASSASGQLANTSHIELAYTDRRLLLQFIAPAFRYPDRIEYRYRMSGLSSSWSVTAQHSLEFPSLPPGRFTFTVQARQGQGAWGKPVSVEIFVATPFWQTWWFAAGCVLGLFALVVLLVRRYFVKKIRLEKEKAAIGNKMLHLRQQALTAMINPHFIFNCLNSVQYYINRNALQESEEYLSSFATLIRLTIEDTQEVTIPLGKELHRLKLYLGLEQLRLGEKLSYTIETGAGLENVLLPNMILQPYVENAILHGIAPKKGPGNLWIRITEKAPGLLHIEIEDDGVGLSWRGKRSTPAKERHSLGMAITRERLDLMSRMSDQRFIVSVIEKKDERGKSAGTLVTMEIPVSPPASAHRESQPA